MIYRFYWIDAEDRINHALDIDCESDADAVREAARRIGDLPVVEVWYGAERVRVVTSGVTGLLV
jgi:hypothetical protein